MSRALTLFLLLVGCTASQPMGGTPAAEKAGAPAPVAGAGEELPVTPVAPVAGAVEVPVAPVASPEEARPQTSTGKSTTSGADVLQEDALTSGYGALGAIVDARTFALQFAVARVYVSSYNHAEDYSNEETEVRWFATDENGDGHPDLRVRETRRSSEGEVKTTNRTEICPYVPAEDRWLCPDPPFAAGLLLPPSG